MAQAAPSLDRAAHLVRVGCGLELIFGWPVREVYSFLIAIDVCAGVSYALCVARSRESQKGLSDVPKAPAA